MLSLEEVRAIAHLARLEVGDAEAAALQQQLNHMLEMIGKMRAVDTSGVEPMSHPQDVVQRLREDRVTEADRHALFQEIAPLVEDGLYLVPKVIE
jgi:aspartyl-tRNA(Asn)/glutamyl-tRNA(Gln) amidotransferase subunit C